MATTAIRAGKGRKHLIQDISYLLRCVQENSDIRSITCVHNVTDATYTLVVTGSHLSRILYATKAKRGLKRSKEEIKKRKVGNTTRSGSRKK